MGFKPLMLFEKKKMSPGQELKCFQEVKKQLLGSKIQDLISKRDKLEEETEEQKVKQKDADHLYLRKVAELNETRAQIWAFGRTNLNSKHSCFDEDFHKVDSVDWVRVALKVSPSKYYSALDVKLHWLHELSPNLKTGAKSVKEKRILKQLLKNANLKEGVDWDKVPEQLAIKTNVTERRTGYDLFCYYQRRLNVNHRDFFWTKVI